MILEWNILILFMKKTESINELTIDQCFEVWKGKINALIREHPLQIISWEATRRCNMKCMHCGSPAERVDLGNELSTKEVIEVFERIADSFDMSGFRHINITGGEPFVRKDLLVILREVSKYSFYRNIDIQTNGLYIAENPEVLDELPRYGVTGIGVSIDGIGTYHDTFRNTKNGFEKAVMAARHAVRKGLVVTVSVVIHAKNIDTLDLIYTYIEQNVKPRVLRFMFIDPIGRTTVDSGFLLSNDQKRRVIDFLKTKYELACDRYADKNTMMVELGCGGWFGKELEGTFRPFIFHCIAGLNNLGILYDGKIASCSNISRDFIEGDIHLDDIRDVWENRFLRYRDRSWKRIGKCKDCKDWDFCHGGPMHLSNNYKCMI